MPSSADTLTPVDVTATAEKCLIVWAVMPAPGLLGTLDYRCQSTAVARCRYRAGRRVATRELNPADARRPLLVEGVLYHSTVERQDALGPGGGSHRW